MWNSGKLVEYFSFVTSTVFLQIRYCTVLLLQWIYSNDFQFLFVCVIPHQNMCFIMTPGSSGISKPRNCTLNTVYFRALAFSNATHVVWWSAMIAQTLARGLHWLSSEVQKFIMFSSNTSIILKILCLKSNKWMKYMKVGCGMWHSKMDIPL